MPQPSSRSTSTPAPTPTPSARLSPTSSTTTPPQTYQPSSARPSRTPPRGLTSPGRSPSSTVGILRTRDNEADLYVLGDSPIHYGTDRRADQLTDQRLAHVAPSERHRYQDRLRTGHGYDDQHRALLNALQRVQREARNTRGGYWIAEANPTAADNGITRTLPRDVITWAVLATDGAADLINHTGRSWPDIAQADADQLTTLLAQLDEWETHSDPDGRDLPRAKRHDDKTIVATASVW